MRQLWVESRHAAKSLSYSVATVLEAKTMNSTTIISPTRWQRLPPARVGVLHSLRGADPSRACALSSKLSKLPALRAGPGKAVALVNGFATLAMTGEGDA